MSRIKTSCSAPTARVKIPMDKFQGHIKECHKEECHSQNILKLADKDTYMHFKNHKNKLMRPFMVYADTESTLQQCDDAGLSDKTECMSKHVINSCCHLIVPEIS